jgi:Lrp/AsnC family leucine-responsive transcriptional regulator
MPSIKRSNLVPTEFSEFDNFDSRILELLQKDARISMAELGRRVHLSQPAVTERVRKLEISGVIKGYRAEVDVSRLGYGIRAIIRLARAEYARVVKLIEQTPEVINAYNVTGQDSWILEIAVIDVAHLDAVATRFCTLTDTATSIVLNAPRENAVVLPAGREHSKHSTRKTLTK